jgi:ribosomal protein S18 acetylase RimI-like enzyme
MRKLSDGIGEIKRLYVVPNARRRGVGRCLAQGIVDVANQLPYRHLVLDTLPSMAAAQSLYRCWGLGP